MSPAIIMLFDVIIKIAPDVIKFVEGLVSDGNSIDPEHVPKILSEMANISKNAPVEPNLGSVAAHSDNVDEPMAPCALAP